MSPLRAVVTGGTGFLGGRIVELLRERGDGVVVVAPRPPSVEIPGAVTIIADVRDATAMRAAFDRADVVFHVAGRTGVWGSLAAFWSVNVEGTRVVLDAARRSGVPRLVYTSTPSVVGYAHDLANGGPDLAYAPVHESAYAETKSAAEQSVLAANGAGIATVALRPHLIIGPGDRQLMPRVVRRATRGGLRVIGDGHNRVDLTYIDNAAWAHLDAADALSGTDARCAGRPYFISNGEPVVLWEWLNEVLRDLDLPQVTRSLSLRTARATGAALLTVWRVLRLPGEPPLTPFLAAALARTHWYDMEPARRDLGYRVRVPMEEATRRTVEWLVGVVEAEAVRARPRAHRTATPKERRDYYIAPSHDFTQYTRDYETKYWRQDTAFDWQQDVPGNLKRHVERLSPAEFSRIGSLTLPLVLGALRRAIHEIRQWGLPADADALTAIGEILPFDRAGVDQAMLAIAPLGDARRAMAHARGQLVILQRQELEARERQRLGLFKRDTSVKRLETEEERAAQAAEVSRLTREVDDARTALRRAQAGDTSVRAPLESGIQKALATIAPGVLADLVHTRWLVRHSLAAGSLSPDARLRDLVWKRQLRALKDIANHALVVEQSAIAPLTMGVIHYKRRREIQEAMTTFVNDEAKHSAVFRRFMAEKLEATERIPDAIIRSGQRYLWLARFLPSGGIFLAVIVEAIGAAYLEFFAEEAHMPEPLFRSICRTIALRDEKRHMDLCAATYNELYRTGTRWERERNRVALRVMMKAAYGDKAKDHPLLQACRAFGVDAAHPYRHVAARLSQQLARVGMYVAVDELLTLMNFSPRRG